VSIKLRPYQEAGVARLRESYAAGNRSVLFVLPTGGGKTVTFCYMATSAIALRHRVLILVHRQELLRQASRSLSSLGVPHGLIAPRFNGEKDQVAVASIQTLDRRIKETAFDFDFVIVDEAHHASATTWSRVLAHFPNAKMLGVTATPMRLDGRGLGVDSGGMFQDLVEGPSISELIEGGFLVPPIVYAYPNAIDLNGLRKKQGDFNLSDLASRVNKPTITGCAVDHYTRLSPGEPAIAFCASIDHAESVAHQFRQAGYNFQVIHGKLGDTERQELISGLSQGRIHGLASVDLISEGTDIPVCSVAILLRPTASTGLYLQQVGRVLRPYDGKSRGLILDHVGNCLKHGLPDDDRSWSLKGMKRARKSDDDGEIFLRQCLKCYHVQASRKLRCEKCGHMHLKMAEPRSPQTREGTLTQMDKDKIRKHSEDKRIAYARCQSYQEMRDVALRFGDKPGAAYHKWKGRQNKLRRGGKEA
jgi:DNA repair protein RadD